MRNFRNSLMMMLLVLLTVPSYADDQDLVLELRQSGEILPLEQILKISRQQQQGRILEVELEKERTGIIYELKVLADDGHVWELKVDAKSGDLIKRERE